MRLDGFGLLVNDMAAMIRFYRDVLGFEIKEAEDASNVYLIKDDTLFLLYGRKDFEEMTSRKYEYIKGLNGHFELALYVDTFEEVDVEYKKAIDKGATSVLEPTTEPWGQRTCYIADPEGNLIEIGSFNKPFRSRLDGGILIMKYEWVEEYLMKKAGVTKDFQEQWNWIRFHVGEKLFAAICRDDETDKPVYITLKLEPVEGEFYRKEYEDIIPGYYMNKVHWNSVKADGNVPDDVVKDLLDSAYTVVFESLSKKRQREIIEEAN